MTRTQANENYARKKQAANTAWAAVRENRTSISLDDMLRQIARKADDELHDAALLQTKFAPSF